jgi:mono/diheme cytochrome c family protein
MLKKIIPTFLSLTLVFAVLVFLPSVAGAEGLPDGGALYKAHCVGCHGEKGNGVTTIAQSLTIKPRDFTKGIFKFKSTPQGTLPTDADLSQTISKGLPGSTMPAFVALTTVEVRAVIKYIKGFSERWEKEGHGEPLVIPEVPKYVDTKRSRRRGKQVFFGSGGCQVCHGTKGDGHGAMSESLVDTWGNVVRPADFTKGVFRAGGEPRDLFRTLKTGVEGTAMPSFRYILRDEDTWNIISYLRSLKQEQPETASENN